MKRPLRSKRPLPSAPPPNFVAALEYAATHSFVRWDHVKRLLPGRTDNAYRTMLYNAAYQGYLQQAKAGIFRITQLGLLRLYYYKQKWVFKRHAHLISPDSRFCSFKSLWGTWYLIEYDHTKVDAPVEKKVLRVSYIRHSTTKTARDFVKLPVLFKLLSDHRLDREIRKAESLYTSFLTSIPPHNFDPPLRLEKDTENEYE